MEKNTRCIAAKLLVAGYTQEAYRLLATTHEREAIIESVTILEAVLKGTPAEKAFRQFKATLEMYHLLVTDYDQHTTLADIRRAVESLTLELDYTVKIDGLRYKKEPSGRLFIAKGPFGLQVTAESTYRNKSQLTVDFQFKGEKQHDYVYNVYYGHTNDFPRSLKQMLIKRLSMASIPVYNVRPMGRNSMTITLDAEY
jgi:hypothetical protein